ncbi:MAG: tRNA uridine-5-carboxymethylaminomethyl(34) synthesis enzyme MnmG [Candidatus Marinimicrobia bacterium]|nr:tRNA uridine-5-carboxymethylaminomethyl(34) synthesis enzyme MnmG [Candidatus Neomarinimicrobiota bacterium]|tara:strand:+ start:4243 stop:6063 length:1821 start_codon:yes stop_codon:yes gene_type:complete
MNKASIIVIGGGHAGIEAANAVLSKGHKVNMFVLDSSAIGRMSCNPSIGGLAKGHLVKEIDALGGIMGRAADNSCLQFKTLNKSKGRAVWGPRAQVDKIKYASASKSFLTKHRNFKVISEEVVDLIVKNNKVLGVITSNKNAFFSDAVIVTTGTFLNGLIHIGKDNYSAGRIGEKAAHNLTDSIINLGFETGRLKTGTPPRIEAKSVDWKKLEPSLGDDNPQPFSYKTKLPFKNLNIPSFIAYTNENVHSLLENNLYNSPMYSGKINGVGPRYCPSIEDKIVRFSDRSRHMLYLEPEWMDSNQIYINGFSTSMPKKIQLSALRSISGLESANLIRPGYAIEYDYFPTRQLKSTLETKSISNLFFAGQVNGTSGYEEAAAQGLLAGINSVLRIEESDPFIINRNEGYIGVLIDDLITSSINEPYRMFTSSAEYRLSLRSDNADFRLTEKGFKAGIVSKSQYNTFIIRKNSVKSIESAIIKKTISEESKSISAQKYLCRPSVGIQDLFNFIPSIKHKSGAALFTAETNIKYEGYVSRETIRANAMLQNERVKIPKNINFCQINGLSSEAVEKLNKVIPENLGQASRIDGVRPSDIMCLSIFIKQERFT